MRNDIFRGCKRRGIASPCTDASHDASWRQCLLRIKMRRSKNGRNKGDVRWFKRIDEGLLKNTPSTSLRSRFKYGPEPCSRMTLAHGAQGLLNCSGMVCKIVVDTHTVHLAANFQPSLHALERRQPALDHIVGYAQFPSDNDDTEGVLYVEGAWKRNGEMPHVRP